MLQDMIAMRERDEARVLEEERESLYHRKLGQVADDDDDDDDDEGRRADLRVAQEDTADAFACDQRPGGGGTTEERRRQILARISAMLDDVALPQAAVQGAAVLAGISMTSRDAAGTSDVSGQTRENFVLTPEEVEATLGLSGDALPREDRALPCRLPAQSYRIYQRALDECAAQDTAYRVQCTSEAFSMRGLRPHELRAPSLPRLTVQYCADFLREPDTDHRERPCANGANCVCNMNVAGVPGGAGDHQTRRRFVCREFLLPDEWQRWHASGGDVLPEHPRLCLACNRLSTTARVLRNLRGTREPIEDLVQDHTLLFDEPGGYRSEYALPMHGDPDGKRYLGLVERALIFDVNHYRCARVRSPYNDDTQLDAWIEHVTHFRTARTGAGYSGSMNNVATSATTMNGATTTPPDVLSST